MPIRYKDGLLSAEYQTPTAWTKAHSRRVPTRHRRNRAVPQHLPWAGLEQMPGAHEIQRWISRTHTTDVD